MIVDNSPVSQEKVSGLEALGTLTFLRSYSKDGKENWGQTTERYLQFMRDSYPALVPQINGFGQAIHDKLIVPSMRAMQFAGDVAKKEHARLYNPVEGSTEVVTREYGNVPIETLDGQWVSVLNVAGRWADAKITGYGEQPLWEVELMHASARTVIRCTDSHRWVRSDGSVVPTTGLAAGDRVPFMVPPKPEKDSDYYDGVKHGIIFGDGTTTVAAHRRVMGYFVRLCGEKSRDLLKFFEGDKVTYPPSFSGDPVIMLYNSFAKTHALKDLPSGEETLSYLRGFMDGWFAADGSVANSQACLCFGESKLSWLQTHSERLGYPIQRVSRRTGDTNYGKRSEVSVVVYFNRRAFSSGDFLRTKHQTSFASLPETKNDYCVRSVKMAECSGRVFCAEVEDTHTFTLAGGVVTGNCSFMGMSDFKDFADLCYLLACGCGVGLSVEQHYIRTIPTIEWVDGATFVIPDSKEGWSDSFEALLSYPTIQFDYSLIRPAGAPLSSGGSASGPLPLQNAHESIRNILVNRMGQQLRSVDVADICCFIAQAIVSGGSRRSALIVLFSCGDEDMLGFKSGNWWDTNIQRAKANISEMNVKNSHTVLGAVHRVMASKTGEPALALVENVSYEDNTGANPCMEASLRSHTFCNLCEVILPNCRSESDMLFASRSASFFGTLQAGFTDFKYIKPDWSVQTKKEALLGVSVTGCAQMPKFVTASLLEENVIEIKKQNRATAGKIGINAAARLTVLKPSGSTSCVMECTSGIHAAHGEYIVRRVRVTKLSPLGLKLVSMFGISPILPTETAHGTFLLPMDKYSFIVHEAYSDKDIVLQFPCHYQGAIYRKNESSVELLERAAWFRKHWIVPGHVSGQETNNVSLTVSHRPHEKEEIIDWMLNNQDKYRGISVLPDDCTAYPLLPFEEVSKEEFDKYYARFPALDFEALGISSNVQGSSACSGGGCEINSL